jgi:hypothetical protein
MGLQKRSPLLLALALVGMPCLLSGAPALARPVLKTFVKNFRQNVTNDGRELKAAGRQLKAGAAFNWMRIRDPRVRTVYRQEARSRQVGKLSRQYWGESLNTTAGLAIIVTGGSMASHGNFLGAPVLYGGLRYYGEHVGRLQPAARNLQQARGDARVATLQRLDLTDHPIFQRAGWFEPPAASTR